MLGLVGNIKHNGRVQRSVEVIAGGCIDIYSIAISGHAVSWREERGKEGGKEEGERDEKQNCRVGGGALTRLCAGFEGGSP